MDNEGCIHYTPVSYTHLDVYKRQREQRGDGGLEWMVCDAETLPMDDNSADAYVCLLYTSRCV